jgi:hypothetical protein
VVSGDSKYKYEPYFTTFGDLLVYELDQPYRHCCCLLHNSIFSAAGIKDYKNKGYGRNIGDNVCVFYFRDVYVADLWHTDRQHANRYS